MTDVLDRILAKVIRAEQHIQDFQLGRTAFFESYPCKIGVKADHQAGRRVYYLASLEAVPFTLAAIGSDVVQNLCSALDQIAYQTVVRQHGSRPDWKVYFPISGSAEKYESTRKGVIKEVPKAVIDAIDAAEPYRGGKGHGFWVLKKLRNPDQHELMIAVDPYIGHVDVAFEIRAAMKAGGFPFEIPSFSLPLVPADRKPLKVGDALYDRPLGDEVQEQPQFGFDISLYEPGVIEGEPAIKTFNEASDLVRGMIQTLSPFLR
ncbi:MAG: hypothetical protein QM699_04130 [Amaricoccus sp.]|uniref:hypothetical protein n=1 Tax=Amaricoccus sp. TaxID=1872485 RepID=UPI0039E3B7CC